MFNFSKNNKQLKSDADLLRNYRETGDLEKLGEVYDRQVHLVYGTCLKYLKNREDGRDAVMQIFEKIIVELKEREVRNFQTWLYVVSKNHCLMHLRKSSKLNIMDGLDEFSPSAFVEFEEPVHPLTGLPHGNTDEMLDKCLEELPEKQKKCISLFYYEGKCYEEITGITGYELKKVKSYLQNGKRNLKNCIDKYHVKRTEPS
jgi:RNA polymerase sigma-70 factor, ECF subfamily